MQAQAVPEVVEAASLIASHDDQGAENPAFPVELQPRDRSKAASQTQIAKISAKLNPALLLPSPQASQGAPIVGADNVVESGNARTLALRRVYAEGRGDPYRQALQAAGYNVEGFAAPVLVQRRMTELDPAQRMAWTREANISPTASRSVTEIATVDAEGLTPELLGLYRGGEVGLAGNRDFVRGFIRSVVPGNEHGAMVTGTGEISQQGLQRVENALFARAFEDAELLSRMREDREQNFKRIGDALIEVAPAWATLRNQVEGTPYDITTDVVDAVRLVRHARDEGLALSELVAQADAFSPVSEETEALVRLFFRNDGLTQPRSAKAVADALRFYAEQAPRAAATSEGGLFGEDLPPVKPLDILTHALEIGGRLPAAAMRAPGDTGQQAQSTDRPVLDPDREVPVVEATSRYRHLTPRNARAQARRDANRQIRGAYRNEDTGWDIEVTRQGISKSLAGDDSAVRAEITANLPALLHNAVHTESGSDTRVRQDVRWVHHFWVPFRLDGRLNRVKLTVREFTDGTKRHYAVDFVEIEPDVLEARTRDADKSARPNGAPSGSTTRIRDFLAGVKYEDGTPIFPLEPEVQALPAVFAQAGAMHVPMRQQTYDPIVPVTGKPVAREKAIRDLVQALGFSVYVGRTKRVRGFFRPATEELRLRDHGDIETLIHEAGHLIDKRFPEIKAHWKRDRVVNKELKSVSYDEKKTNEGFAEYVRLWATQPDAAVEAAPEFTAWWKDWLDKHPKEGKALRQFRDTALAWFEQSAEDRLASVIGGNIPVNESMGIGAVIRNAGSEIRQKAMDDLHGIARFEKHVAGEKGERYETARLTRGAMRVVLEAIHHGPPKRLENGDIVFRGRGLEDILEPVSDNLDAFFKYAVAVSAAELKTQGRERLIKADMIEAGLALETPARKAAFAGYQEWNKGLVDFAQSMGIIDPEARRAWRRNFYLPFHRVANQMMGERRPEALLGDWHGIRRLTGGTANLNPIMENIVQNAATLIKVAIKNEALAKVAALAHRDKGGHFMAPIPTLAKPVLVNRAEIQRVALEALGTTIPEFLPVEQQMTLDAMMDGLNPMVQMWQFDQAPKGRSVVAVLKGGKASYYEVLDPFLMRSLLALDRPPAEKIIQDLARVRNFRRAAITMSPDFMVRNMFRDTITAWVMSRYGFRPFVDSARGFLSALRQDQDYQDFMANGGGFATFHLNEDNVRAEVRAFYKKKGINLDTVLDVGSKTWIQLNKFAEAFELAARLGEYKRAREKGATRRQAAYAGREVSVDFAMRGDSNAISAYYDITLFLKAAVNAFDRLGRGFITDPHRSHIAWKTAMVSLVSMGLWALNFQNPLYDELEDWDRDGYWHIFVPTPAYYNFVMRHDRDPYTVEEAKDLFTHLRLPKIWEIGAVASMSERFLEELVGDSTKKNGEAMVKAMRNLMSVDLAPAFIAPLYEIWLNKRRFTDTPIESEGMKNLQPYLRSRAWNSRIGQSIARRLRKTPLELSPVQFDHLIKGYMGYWGSYGLLLSDRAFFDSTPEMRMDEIPGIRSFFRQHPGQSNRYRTEFWERFKLSREAYMTMREAARRGQTEDAEDLVQTREAQEYRGLNRIASALRDARKLAGVALRSEDLAAVQQIAAELVREGLMDQALYLRHQNNIRSLKRHVRDALTAWSNQISRETMQELGGARRAVR